MRMRSFSAQDALKIARNFGDEPNAVSERTVSNAELSELLALTEFQGESSVNSSQPIICVPKRTHRVLCRTHRVCCSEFPPRRPVSCTCLLPFSGWHLDSCARDHPNSRKNAPRMKGQMKIFHVGSRQFRESLRELLRELWFSYCSSREMPFREWNLIFREWNFEFRELLREYPGTLRELREPREFTRTLLPARSLLIVCYFLLFSVIFC